MATAVAAAAVLLVPFAVGSETLASSTASTSGGTTIVASSATVSAVSTSASQTSTGKASKTAAIGDATTDEQPATIRSVNRQVVGDPRILVGPRAVGASVGTGTGTVVRTSPGSVSQKVCPADITGSTETFTTPTSANNVEGTTSDDLAAFADTYNATRVANCLQPIPLSNFRLDTCMQDRIFWMADDPSSNASSAWGHTSTAKRSDGLAIEGCDGDLDGGMSYTGSTVATDWWNSTDHRESLYQPSYTGSVADVCIGFAMTHGGYNATPPNEPITFVRAIAAWQSC